MGLILCMAGAAGALASVLAIAVLCLMGKKAGVPLGLFALGCCGVALIDGAVGRRLRRSGHGGGVYRGLHSCAVLCGVALLLDDRYHQPDYERLCPAHWRFWQGDAQQALEAFWQGRLNG